MVRPGFLVMLGVAAWLGGCAPASSHGPPTATLRVLVPPSERPYGVQIARRFEREHPGTSVQVVEGPQSTDLRENLYTASLLARDPTFDLVYMDVTWTAKFAAAGWLRALDGRLTEEERHAFLRAALAAGEFEDSLYRVPVRTDVGLLYYRRDKLEAAGVPPPQTFDELAHAARALQSPPSVW